MNIESEIISRLNISNVWWARHNNYDNEQASGCRQAVLIRHRLGAGDAGGVPLWCELRSQLGTFLLNGKKQYFVAHTRANTNFDLPKIAQLLSVDEDSISLEALLETKVVNKGEPKILEQKDSNFFGLINPLSIDLVLRNAGIAVDEKNIFQIFDSGVFHFGGVPDTITTNIGNRHKFFEINPADLLEVTKSIFSNVLVGQVSKTITTWNKPLGGRTIPEWLDFPPPRGPKIGILTGNSPESGKTLWSDFLSLFRRVYSKSGSVYDMSMPCVLLSSIPEMGLSMEIELREKEVWLNIERELRNLLEAGCNLITVACNTTIFFEDKITLLCDEYSALFLSIAEPAANRMSDLAEKFPSANVYGLVGIGSVVDFEKGYSGYKRHLDSKNIQVIPSSGEEIGYAVKNVGESSAEIRRVTTSFRKLLNKDFPEGKVAIIILALTEASMVFRKNREIVPKKARKQHIFIDSLHELAKELIVKYLVQGYISSKVCLLDDAEQVEIQIRNHFDLVDPIEIPAALI